MKNFIHQIAENCPIGERLPECPFSDLTNASEQHTQLVEDLGNSEAKSIISHHRQCMKKRCSILLNSAHTVQSWKRVSLM